MRITQLDFFSYRNLADAQIMPCEGVNIFFGDNAQGKTNLLEAIWLCTGARSFRGSRDAELIKFGEDALKISVGFESLDRQQNITLKIDKTEKNKNLYLNGISADPPRISEVYSAVVFSPVHLSIIKDGPQERRKFLDTALCQLKPGFIRLINDYSRALSQRNAILKDAAITEDIGHMLDIFEESLAKTGSELSYQRQKYTELLFERAGEYFSGLSSGKDELSLVYSGKDYADRSTGCDRLLFEYKNSRSEDIRLGYTTAGPHRHDLEINVNSRSARSFASQGQQRSAAVSLKLAEAAVLEHYSSNRPVALLDDVMSELDIHRQEYILNRLDGWQVFITACDPSPIEKSSSGEFFNIKNGVIDCVSSRGRK